MDTSLAHQRRAKSGIDGEGVYTDQCVKFCTKCKHCYEIVVNETRMYGVDKKVYNMLWLTDFPSYGKEKKTCPRCLGQPTILEVIK